MEIAKYISDGTTRTYAPPCTFKAALNLGVYVNNSYIDRDDYELIRGQVLFKSTTVPPTGTIVEIRVDNTVSDISTASLDDLNICANNIADINSVADRIDDVLALAPSMGSIEIVADNIANITEVHTTIIPNITEILSADTNAGIATTQATNATNQASNALTSANTAIDKATVATAAANNALSYRESASASATTATNKATEASTYASNASTSATLAQGYANDASTSKNTTQGYMTTTEAYKNTTQGYMNNASTSATNASNSATNAASTLSNFNSKYTSSDTAPASPTEGMLWYDTATNIMKVYDGSGWINAGSSVNGTSSRNTYTATAGQTTFSATYDSGYVDVYRNGLKLSNSDFVATNGTTIVLNNACSLNDVVDIVAYGTFELVDAYTKNDSDVLLSAKTPYTIINEDSTVKLISLKTKKSWTKGFSGTGALQIELQNLYGFSLDGRMEVRLKETLGNAITIYIDGRWDASNTWSAYNAKSSTAINVRFAKDASKVYILIGDTSTVWGNTRVEIDNVLANYNSGLNLDFVMSVVSSYPTTVVATVNANIFNNTVFTGNITLSGTPIAWGSTLKATQIGRSSISHADSNFAQYGTNMYYDGAYKYIANGYASRLVMDADNGVVNFATAPSGTAGNTITWTTVMSIDTSRNVLVTGAGGLGYGTGSGGTVTQLTSKQTAVTLNKPSGYIVMSNSVIAAGTSTEFQFSNSIISSSDTLILNCTSFTSYRVEVRNITGGAAIIRVTNISGSSLSEALVINFNVIKGATS